MLENEKNYSLINELVKDYIEELNNIIKYVERIYINSCNNKPKKYFFKDYKKWESQNNEIYSILLKYYNLYSFELQKFYFQEEEKNYKK